MFYLTSRDAKIGTPYVIAAREYLITSDRYFHQEHFATNQKTLRLPIKSGSNVFDYLDL